MSFHARATPTSKSCRTPPLSDAVLPRRHARARSKHPSRGCALGIYRRSDHCRPIATLAVQRCPQRAGGGVACADLPRRGADCAAPAGARCRGGRAHLRRPGRSRAEPACRSTLELDPSACPVLDAGRFIRPPQAARVPQESFRRQRVPSDGRVFGKCQDGPVCLAAHVHDLAGRILCASAGTVHQGACCPRADGSHPKPTWQSVLLAAGRGKCVRPGC